VGKGGSAGGRRNTRRWNIRVGGEGGIPQEGGDREGGGVEHREQGEKWKRVGSTGC